MIPAKSFPFAKVKKSDNLMKFPAFWFLGFLNTLKVLIGFDIMAANTKVLVLKQMHDQGKKYYRWAINYSLVINCTKKNLT